MGPKMPVSVVCESPAEISSAIRNSLPNNIQLNGGADTPVDGNIQNQFISSAKRVLLAKIEYEEVYNRNANQDALKSKYIVLKTGTSTPISNGKHNGNTPNGALKDKLNGCTTEQSSTVKKEIELPVAKYVLYGRDQVQVGWKSSARKWQVGAGMLNMGNTCYLNSTLQALFHVPAFANWLMSDTAHRESCENRIGGPGSCINCAMAKTCIHTQQSNQPIKPYLVYSKLRLVCKHLVPGQQEDAHEFLRYLMEAMEKAYLLRFPNSKQFDQFSKETTPINQILGGYLKSSVRCLSCGHVSVTFQHFEELLLDIRKANSVEESLDSYFARERLEDMGYKCESCKKKVSATKQFSLERPPIALCIQLKRFSMAGNKINKHITIREHLNLSKFASKKGMTDQMSYRLVAMVTHLGASQHCGHYTAIGLTDAGGYYQFDDSCVRPISLQNVLNTNAYIIFYELDSNVKCSNAMENGKIVQEQRNGISSMIKVCPSTQTSTKHIELNKRKVEIALHANGTDNAGDENTTLLQPLTSSNKKVMENGNDHASKPATLSTFFNAKKKNENLITIKLNNPSNLQTDTASNCNMNKTTAGTVTNGHNKATLPSLPVLDDTDDYNYEIKINVALNRPTNVSCDGKNNAVTTNSRQTVPYSSVDKTPRKSLVPYTSDDDDDDDEDDNDDKHADAEVNATNSNVTQCVKTSRSGPFQVTPTIPSQTNDTLSSPTVQITSTNVVTFKRNDITNNAVETSTNHMKATTNSAPLKRPHLTIDDDTNDTAKKLLKMNHRGYGANVLSWNGSKSNLETEVNEDKKEEQHRQILDANDAEMDRGQTKKIKTGVNGARTNPGYNPFTETQISRNSWIISNGNANGKGQGQQRPPYYPVFNQKPNRNRFHGQNYNRNYGKRYFGHNNSNNKKAFINRRHPNNK